MLVNVEPQFGEDLWGYANRIKALAIVNPVNTVGVSGKGIALEVVKRCPWYQGQYKRLASQGALTPGGIMIYRLPEKIIFGNVPSIRCIVDAATKEHYSQPATMVRVQKIASMLQKQFTDRPYEEWMENILIPALGCGAGGLEWRDVHKTLNDTFVNLPPNVNVHLFPHVSKR